MDMTEKFLQNNNLQDEYDIDALIELASLVRALVSEKQYEEISRVINYTIEHGYNEALSWCLGILQEEYEKEDCALEHFECALGKSIPDYDGLIERLQVDLTAPQNGVETVRDPYGEVESFFNILVYETGFANVRFISSENFDTKDNDYVQYKLSFLKQA